MVQSCTPLYLLVVMLNMANPRKRKKEGRERIQRNERGREITLKKKCFFLKDFCQRNSRMIRDKNRKTKRGKEIKTR